MDTEKQYYYLNAARETLGPKTLPELKGMLEAGTVKPDTYIAAVGDPKWIRLEAALHGAAPTTATNGAVGTCPRCGTGLLTETGELPATCPQCGFAVDTPHSTRNMLANFWFSVSKKYCCFRGRATRAEYWGFALISWVLGQAVSYLGSSIHSTLLGIPDSHEALQQRLAELAEQAEGLESLRQIFRELLQGVGFLPTDSVSTLTFSLAIAALALPYLLSLALLLPSWGLSVRRLHDVGWSGLWFIIPQVVSITSTIVCAIYLCTGGWRTLIESLQDGQPLELLIWSLKVYLGLAISCLPFVILCFILSLLDSKRGPNKYGPSPKYPLG